MDVKLYLALAGSLGLAYVTYNMLNKPKIITISKEQTLRISQEIKHQIMILCISYAKSMKKIKQENAEKLKGRLEQLTTSARNQLSQLYVAKQQLILKKFSISREIYGKSLEKWKNDKKLTKNTDQILSMLECAVNGTTPDLTIPQAVYQKFTREQVLDIYRDMVTLIGKKVADRLRQQVDRNKDFDLKSDDHFRTAVRSLQIYDLKVNFLKQKGFSASWGCPNQVFFKYLESEKLKDQQYEKKAVGYEKCYEKVIEIVSLDPKKATDAVIEEMFEKALTVPAPPAVVAPVPRPVPVVEAPKPFVAPVKKEQPPKPVEEAELDKIMADQLFSRSQQAQRMSQSQIVEPPRKLGLTSSQVQNEWQRYGSIHEKDISKMEEAAGDVAVNDAHEKDIEKALENKVQEEIKVAEGQVEGAVEEPVLGESGVDVEPVVADVEPVVQAAVQQAVQAVVQPAVVQVVIQEAVEAVVVVEQQQQQQPQPEQEQEQEQEQNKAANEQQVVAEQQEQPQPEQQVEVQQQQQEGAENNNNEQQNDNNNNNE